MSLPAFRSNLKCAPLRKTPGAFKSTGDLIRALAETDTLLSPHNPLIRIARCKQWFKPQANGRFFRPLCGDFACPRCAKARQGRLIPQVQMLFEGSRNEELFSVTINWSRFALGEDIKGEEQKARRKLRYALSKVEGAKAWVHLQIAVQGSHALAHWHGVIKCSDAEALRETLGESFDEHKAVMIKGFDKSNPVGVNIEGAVAYASRYVNECEEAGQLVRYLESFGSLSKKSFVMEYGTAKAEPVSVKKGAADLIRERLALRGITVDPTKREPSNSGEHSGGNLGVDRSRASGEGSHVTEGGLSRWGYSYGGNITASSRHWFFEPYLNEDPGREIG